MSLDSLGCDFSHRANQFEQSAALYWAVLWKQVPGTQSGRLAHRWLWSEDSGTSRLMSAACSEVSSSSLVLLLLWEIRSQQAGELLFPSAFAPGPSGDKSLACAAFSPGSLSEGSSLPSGASFKERAGSHGASAPVSPPMIGGGGAEPRGLPLPLCVPTGHLRHPTLCGHMRHFH